jgi:hypothetical protein
MADSGVSTQDDVMAAYRTYKIDVCAECGERVLAVGYLCNHLHESLGGGQTRVVEVVPVEQFRVAVEEGEALQAALKDVVNHWVLSDAPEDAVVTRAMDLLDCIGDR